MEGQVSSPGWPVAGYTEEFWRAVETRQNQFIARHDRENAAISTVAICGWRRLRGAITDHSGVSS